MTPKSKPTPKRVGSIIKAVRKWRGLSQIDLAKGIDISQSYLSKLEAGLLEPDTSVWFNFCDFTQIPAESWRDGFVDSLSSAVLRSGDRESGFLLPKRFTVERGTKVRLIRPILEFIRKEIGNSRYLQYLEKTQVDPSFFMILDHQISFEFVLELFRFCLKEGILSQSHLDLLAAQSATPSSHGKLYSLYHKQLTSQALLQSRIQNSIYYDCDFQYSYLEIKNSVAQVHLVPEPHILHTSYIEDTVLRGLYSDYFKNSLDEFLKLHGKSYGHIECLKDSRSKGQRTEDFRCIYQIPLS